MELLMKILKAIWSEGGLPWWRVLIVVLILFGTTKWFAMLANQKPVNIFSGWLHKANKYIWVWIISMIIFGGYGIIIPFILFAAETIGFVAKFITTPNNAGVLPLRKLIEVVKTQILKKE